MFSLGRLDILVRFRLQADVYKFGVIFVFIIFNVEARFLKIDYITRDPSHYGHILTYPSSLHSMQPPIGIRLQQNQAEIIESQIVKTEAVD